MAPTTHDLADLTLKLDRDLTPEQHETLRLLIAAVREEERKRILAEVETLDRKGRDAVVTATGADGQPCPDPAPGPWGRWEPPARRPVCGAPGARGVRPGHQAGRLTPGPTSRRTRAG